MQSTDDTIEEAHDDDSRDADSPPEADQVSEEIIIASPPCESQSSLGSASLINVPEKVRYC